MTIFLTSKRAKIDVFVLNIYIYLLVTQFLKNGNNANQRHSLRASLTLIIHTKTLMVTEGRVKFLARSDKNVLCFIEERFFLKCTATPKEIEHS